MPTGDFQQVVWQHVGCILNHKATQDVDPHTYKGFDKLKPQDQELLLQDYNRIQQEKEESSTKRKRKTQDNDSEPSKKRPEPGVKQIPESQQEEFRSICEFYETMDVEDLKSLLRKNLQKDSGVKSQLVERCALGKMLGVWPLCPLCNKGMLKATKRKTVLECSGYKENGAHVKCAHSVQTTELTRLQWQD